MTAALALVFLLAFFPHAQAFTYGSQYGSLSEAIVTDGAMRSDGGDGFLTSSASISGGDGYGDSNSSSAFAYAASHTVGAATSVDCGSSNVCYDNGEGSNGIGGSSEGDTYDTYTITCGTPCLGGGYADIWVAWAITGDFGGLENGTCAQRGCNGNSWPAVSQESLITPWINVIGSGGSVERACGGYAGINGCPPSIIDYLQGWPFCQGGADPQYYCPASTSFTLSGATDLGSGFSTAQPFQLEFLASANSDVNIPTSESSSFSATFTVFTDTPDISITSAACGGCHTPANPSSTSVVCTPGSDPANEATTCAATVTGGGPTPTGYAYFYSSANDRVFDVCTLSAGTCSVPYTPALGTEGTTTITAMYGGDENYQTSQNTFQLSVTTRSSSTFVFCVPNPMPVGQAGTCTATVSDTGGGTLVTPTGTIGWSTSGSGSFTSNTCNLAGGTCSVEYTADEGSEGTHTITATYSGDTDHQGSIGTVLLGVVQRHSYTSLSCAPKPVPVDNPTTCTATVVDASGGTSVTPTGTVSFSTGSPGAFSPTSCTLSAGSCSVTYTPNPGSEGTQGLVATYSGDSVHTGSLGNFNLDATAHSTSTSLTCSPQKVPVGAPTTCTVSVTDTTSGVTLTPSGSVGFTSSMSGAFTPSASCNLSGSGATASCSVTYAPGSNSLGDNKIDAKYGGNVDQNASSQTFKVTGAVRATSTKVSCAPPYNVNNPITCTVTVTDTSPGTAATPTGTVTFTSSQGGTFSSTTCTLSGSGGTATCHVKFTPTKTGPNKVMANYAGDTRHSLSSGFQSFKVV